MKKLKIRTCDKLWHQLQKALFCHILATIVHKFRKKVIHTVGDTQSHMRVKTEV